KFCKFHVKINVSVFPPTGQPHIPGCSLDSSGGNMRLWIWVVLAVLVIGIGGVAVKNAFAADPPAVGTQAPEFTLPTQEGNPVSLKEFHGKWVVLYFYPKDM